MRWRALRFIWKPYQHFVPHRSWISHSRLWGPVLRVIYFTVVMSLLAFLVLAAINALVPVDPTNTMLNVATQIRGWLESRSCGDRVCSSWIYAGRRGAFAGRHRVVVDKAQDGKGIQDALLGLRVSTEKGRSGSTLVLFRVSHAYALLGPGIHLYTPIVIFLQAPGQFIMVSPA